MDCPTGFWCLQFKDLVPLIAVCVAVLGILYGPVRTLSVNSENERRRERRRRQDAIFMTLMRTRRMALMPEHVMALNVIEIEFYEQDRIRQAFKRYVEHLGTAVPPAADAQEPFKKEREDRFFELVHEIGKHLGFMLDKRDLEKFSYMPQGWNDVDWEQRQLRLLMIEMLSGKRALPTVQFNAAANNDKFPPPPKVQ